MSTDDFEKEAARRDYRAPFSHDHPIPTIQKYREHRDELKGQNAQAEAAQHTDEDDSRAKRAFNAVKSIVKNEDKDHPQGDPYPTSNRNQPDASGAQGGPQDSSIPDVPRAGESSTHSTNQSSDANPTNNKDNGNKAKGTSATERAASEMDPKQKRKNMKHNKRDDGGREVTDPVTHLPLVIRDSTPKDLKRAPENLPRPGEQKHTSTGLSSASKSSSQLEMETEELQGNYEGMQKMFPPPAYDDTKAELIRTYQLALTTGLVVVTSVAALVVITLLFVTRDSWWSSKGLHKTTLSVLAITAAIIGGTGVALIVGLRDWLGKKVDSIWQDEVWDAARSEEEETQQSSARLPESVAWMNSLLASVWPLINPDLFASIVDMLEDVMQASLPKVVRMVSVDDLGQGSEAIRILGIRWLPTGAADKSVDEEGNLKNASNSDANDRGAPGEGEQEDNEKNIKNHNDSVDTKKNKEEQKQKDAEEQAVREGMEAEQGDFVNMELAFAYRARSSGKSIKSKAKNAHLYLKFYLPGGIFVPVWVELRGVIGTMRLRLQLTPDPPFFSLCTLTFLGQPKADLSCVPLSRLLPNLMDLPLISSFVQSAIDAALAEYVAPKSLTLDLKDMLVGDDFKKDTVSRGVIVIFIKAARGFKEGDGGFGPMKGSSDSYVTCSWGKFGKTISSTRIIEADQEPRWDEWAYMLVSPEELNAEENLRLQLWDSDKYSADDDLGRVEVDLKELVHGTKTKNQMYDREDRFMGEDAEEKMPGTLSWSVGYYAKTKITADQLAQQTEDDNIQTKEDLKKQVSEAAERKLREATAHDEARESKQQKAQDYKERENALICSSPPDPQYPSGMLAIQIHNITGLEIESLQKKDKDGGQGSREDEAEQSDDLPSSYCTLILNHRKIYTTRTKPKNAKPFFNAGTERFVRDWRTAEVMVTVRDSRERENDALLGIVYLPLAKVLGTRSQVMNMYPLVGGIGFGRARISMVFRSVELQMSKELLGWEYGTLEIQSPVKSKGTLPDNLSSHRIKIRSNMARAKMSSSENGQWTPKHDKETVFLPVRNRFATPLIVEFRKSSMGPDSTPAFAVFWLKDIPDEEEKTISMRVWTGGKENIKRATSCSGYEGSKEGDHALGEIEITMKFWRGLSGYHKSYAQKGKNGDMRNVMEALDTVNDEIEGSGDEDDDEDDTNNDDDTDNDDDDSDSSADETGTNGGTTAATSKNKKLKMHTNQDTDDPDPDDEVKSTNNPIKKIKGLGKDILNGHNDDDDASRGPIKQMRDYKDHHKQLHRKHRGIMQWRVARTADYAFDKVRRMKSKASDVFEHSEKDTGVETEV